MVVSYNRYEIPVKDINGTLRCLAMTNLVVYGATQLFLVLSCWGLLSIGSARLDSRTQARGVGFVVAISGLVLLASGSFLYFLYEITSMHFSL